MGAVAGEVELLGATEVGADADACCSACWFICLHKNYERRAKVVCINYY